MGGTQRIIVVGAGIIGASIAWHLAAAGAEVTVLDGGEAGGVATPCSFAWINATWGNPEPYFRLRMRAMAEWRRLAAAVPEIPLRWCGGLRWDLEPDEVEAFARQHAAWGYGVRKVGLAEVARLEPSLLTPPDLALHVAEEGAVEPGTATLALLRAAEGLGAGIVTGQAVRRLTTRAGRVIGVETDAGPLAAEEVVVAAGTGTAVLLATVGVELPMDDSPGLLVHSHPHAPLLQGLVMAPELHMRQSAEGRILAAADFGGSEPGDDPAATARAVFATAKSMLRGAEDLTLDFHTVGCRPMPADGFPAIGRLEELQGIYVAVMHSGITLAPAVGLFVRDEILRGERNPLLAPYGLSRLARA